METVNNLTSAASRAIWGDSTSTATNTETNQTTSNETSGREPLSGEMGNVEAGEPYDKGNADSTTTEPTHPIPSSTSPSNPSSNQDPTNPTSNPATNPLRPEHETAKTGVTSHHNPTSATASDPPTSRNDTASADPSSGITPGQKQQGADRPEEKVGEGTGEHERILEAKREAEEAQKVDVSGPGPKNLADRSKDNGTGSSEAGEEDGPQKESKGEGTGEKYIKSSGMKADGGDFDASNPGAGKEADRLLEEKGIHHTAGPGPAEPTDADAGVDDKATGKEGKEGKEKVSLKDKIKAKLHKS